MRLALVALAICISFKVNAAAWQYSVPIGERGARAHLYIPPQCERVRGVVIALDNLLEKPLLEDPLIRDAAAAEQLAIVWIAADVDGKRPFDKGFQPGDGGTEQLDTILSNLATQSGYDEIAKAPLLPLGHSAGVPFAVGLGYALPQRVMAIIDLKSVLPPRPKDATLEGIPLLIVKGQFEEWAKPPALVDREASWRDQRTAALGLRKRSERNLVGFVLDAGGGHFESGEDLTRLIALCIRKAAHVRLAADNTLKAIAPDEGWLTDSATALEDGTPVIAGAKEFGGERAKAFWYFDKEMAEAARHFGAKQRGKSAQFVTIMTDGKPVPLNPRGTVEMDFRPLEDSRTFTLDGAFFDQVPGGVIGAGTSVAHAEGLVRIEAVRGPLVKIAPNMFRVQFDQNGFSWRGADAWFVAVNDGDATHRRAVQPVHIAFPRQNTRGLPQHITFPEIGDQSSTASEVELKATSDSGLAVQYYVLSGPAEIVGGRLRLTPIPPRSRWPVEVIVVAYQWGRSIEPLIQSAEPVTRTFHILKPAPRAAFVHPGLLHSQADLDRMRQHVDANDEPWKSGFEKLRQDRASHSNWKLNGPLEVVTRAPAASPGNQQMVLDGDAAYQNALMWCITRDEAHAKKAVEILNAWGSHLRKMDGKDVQLSAGLNGFKFVNAAELMRHTYPAWKRDDVAQFEHMLKEAVLPPIKDFASFANGNWDAACLKTMMAIGVFCDDRELFDRAVNYFLNGEGNGRLTHYIIDEDGQCQESGRDQQHAQLGLGLLAEACEIAWHQSVDLYGECDNRLLKGFEYTAKYNLGNDVPFVTDVDTTGKYKHKKIATEGRGNLRPIYEMVWNHFQIRRGVAAPFTKQAADKIRPEGSAWGSDHPGFGTLLFTLPTPPIENKAPK